MFRPPTLTYLAGCSASSFRLFGFWLGIGLLFTTYAEGKKISPSVIVASIEGEVSSLSMVDDFKVQMGSTSVGKKINPKTILTTGKTGKVALLFSNGTLITIKPGSRFYLRTYKQLEGIVEGSVDPGKLEEEPTQSELSGHLDYGDLVVKAPKLKKGSSMKLTSPLGVAGIRGTMFQLMAVRNSVTGDIMGGINLISGDIDFTDTGGNTVSLLSGQSIQLATSKLGAPVASMTGELVDLSSTYGPALTDGFTPPPPQSIFPNLSSSGDSSSDDSESEEESFNEPTQQTFASSGGSNFEFIHNLATDLFFEIEEAETSSSEFSFESMALAPTIDIPTPQPEAPVAPPSVTGETLAGGDLEFFQGGHPELKLLGANNSTDPLVKIFNNGARMQVEMRAPSEGITWRKIDPWVQALDFLGNDITPGVQLSGAPKILLANSNSAESEAPPPGSSVSYEVSYSIRDLRGLNTLVFRQVDVVATRPTIEIPTLSISVPLSEPSYSSFFQWIDSISVKDVRGNALPYEPNENLNSFYLEGFYDLDALGISYNLNIVATDWRGLKTVQSGITLSVIAEDPTVIVDGVPFQAELSDATLSSLVPPINAIDEFDDQINDIVLSKVESKSSNSLVDINSQVDELKKNEIYEFTYIITDSRGVATTQALDFYVTVTSPTLESIDFNSSFITANSPRVLEYGDPEQELDTWFTQATAKDFNNNALNISISVQEKGVARTLDEFKSQTPFDGLSNTKLYNITFSATDPRWKSGTDASWEPYLKISNSHEISVIATPPKLELFFHEPRSALPEIDHGNKIIPFLVRSKGDFKDLDAFKDDGEFKISPDPGEGKRDSRKLYYKATAYDGLGDEITHLNLVDLDGVEAVDSETLNSDSIITLSINDQSIRGSGVTGGAKSEISYTVDVVDVISPLISIVDHEDPVEGIMPEIYLLSGKIKDQVRGNSHEKYYFPDPGLVILDNYYNQEEITNYNNITVDNEYVFDYVYEAETKTYNSVWEFPNRALDISVVGSYEIFYSINDPSGNLSKNFDDPNSAEVSRQVNVVDSRNPIVKLYGSSTMYVDLQSIIDQESRFLDPGAYAIENLYVSGKGLFDWKTVDSDLVWDVSYSLCNDLENDTYDEPVRPDDGSDLIESTIQGYLDDPDRLPTEAIRFKVTYALKDKPFLNNSPNEGDVTRIVELRGSPNLFPHIYFVLNHPDNEDGIPSKSNIEGNIAKLPKLIWKVEVGVDQFSAVPNAIVFNDLGGDVRENVQYSTSLLFLDEKNQTRSNPTYSYAISDYLKKVNYWDKQLSSPYYILFNEQSNTYLKYPEGNQNWRRVVIRYSSSENEVGNRSIRDLEIRLVDESEPSLQKNAFENKPIEVGEPFVDPGVEVLDKANSEVGLNKFIDIDHPQGLDDNSTFDELAARGFWTTGDYTITYNATDEFGNQAESQTLNLRVQDSIDPHVAVVTHEVLEKYNSGNDLSFSDLSYQDGNDPIVSPNEVFMNDANLQSSLASLSNLYKDFKFSSEVPFLLENNSKDFLLKSSELDDDFLQNLKGNPKELVLTTSKVVSITDDFGRSYLWYSPFKLTFDDGSSLQDPGFLIFEPSDSGVTIDATLRTEFFGDNQDQIKLVSVNLAITQSNTSARQTSISDAREYLFLDDVKPILQISPQTNAISTFVKVEAGYDYEDTVADNSKFPILEDGIVRVEDGEVLSVSAYDLSDGDVSANITRKVEDLNGSGVTNVETGYDYVNHIYKIEYNATDSADPPNFADAVFRYLKILDTTPPLIYPQADAALSDNFEIDYLGDAPDSNDENEVEDYLLQGLVASDYGAKGAGNGQVIDANLDWSNPSYRDKWKVVITKPDGSAFDPGKVFPFAKEGEGYDVNITVTDEFGNTSLPKLRKLKVGDFKKPTITLIGSSEIHDFLRFSTNKDLENNELYFTDRPVGDLNLEYNSTGFSGGAHRILHADYNFIDPGVYAEDDNSYFGIGDGFKDLDGDGIGETYAIRRVDERSKMVDCNDNNPNTNDIGVIFAYSVLEKVTNPTLHFQKLLFDDTFGINTESLADYVNFPAIDDENNTVSIAAVKVPDLDNNDYDFNSSHKDNRTNLDVVKITIEYRVKDGWDNFSDIKERLVFIYESRQFPGFAFYATPLTDGDGGPFEQYYDNGSGLPFLNSTRKDTDGDGVSDYWELAFGSNPEDRTSIPSHDLSDPKVYNDINFTISNTP